MTAASRRNASAGHDSLTEKKKSLARSQAFIPGVLSCLTIRHSVHTVIQLFGWRPDRSH